MTQKKLVRNKSLFLKNFAIVLRVSDFLLDDLVSHFDFRIGHGQHGVLGQS